MMNGKIDEEIMDVMEANEDDIELFEDDLNVKDEVDSRKDRQINIVSPKI